MTLASAALGPATLSEEDTNKDVLLPPPHLMVLVDLCKGLSGEGYYPYSALVDLGATYKFISQSVADKLGQEVVKAERKRNRKKMPPPITTVNGEPLRSTAVILQMVRMRDGARTWRNNAINFVIADIAHYNLILSMAWLRKQNYNIH